MSEVNLERLEAIVSGQIEVLKAEAAFREKKAAGTLTREDRQALRDLRQEWRSTARPIAEDGAQPKSIYEKEAE